MEKAVKSKQRAWRLSLIGTVCVLMLAVAAVLCGVSGTNARADSADGGGIGEKAEYKIIVTKSVNDGNISFDVGIPDRHVELPSSTASLQTASLRVLWTNPIGNTGVAELGELNIDKVNIVALTGVDLALYGDYSFKLYMNCTYRVFALENCYCDLGTFSHTVERPTVPLPEEPSKEGHHFVGWYYDAALTQPYDGQPIYEETTLYPKFEINTYTVTYDVAGGTPIASATVEWNTAAPVPEPTRTGFVFTGWTLNSVAYNGEAITSNVTLVANWEILMLKVTFLTEGGAEYGTITVPYGATLVKAMEVAKLAAMRAMDTQGVRVSKTSAITEDTQVLVRDLTRMEKIGDYVGSHAWVVWTVGGVIVGLLAVCALTITALAKRR